MAHALGVSLEGAPPELTPDNVVVTVTDPGDDVVAGPVACDALGACTTFDLPAGDYRLTFEVADVPDVAYAVVRCGGDDDAFEVSIVDADVEVTYCFVGVVAPPTTSTTTTTIPTIPTTTTTVASGGPVPVDELPQTGADGRLALVALALLAGGAGLVALSRRRPNPPN